MTQIIHIIPIIPEILHTGTAIHQAVCRSMNSGMDITECARSTRDCMPVDELRTDNDVNGKKTGYRKWYKERRVYLGVLAAYSLLMLYLLFVRNRGSLPADPVQWRLEHSNFIPFASTAGFAGYILDGNDPDAIRRGIVNLAGNTILFIPFGFLIPLCFWRFRSFLCVMLLMAATVILVELMQLMTLRGSCDVDDLLLNLVGTAAGYVLFMRCGFLTASDFQPDDARKNP